MANEKRLIDADARIEEIKKAHCTNCDNYNGVKCRACWVDDAIGLIDDAPTVDAVEVAEYDAVVEKLENLLCHATGGKYSKAGYSWEEMERMVTDYIEECCEEAIAEELVRCKDCKHYDNSEGICWCTLNSKFFPGGLDWHGFPEDGFCSYGERREGE